MTLTLSGYYNPTSRAGRLYAKYRNDSTATVIARIYFVVTEDSCYYVGSNGDPWHNHVARDYLPTQTGILDTIAAGDSATQYRDFTINASWNASRCKIITWLQADGTRNAFQGGIQKATDLPVGIEEITSPEQSTSMVTVAPNPCLSGTSFRFQVPISVEYKIRIFDISGRCVRTMTGVSRSSVETYAWNLRTDQGGKVNAGVYFYTFDSPTLRTNGKIIVR